MTQFAFMIIHPNCAADFVMRVSAKSEAAARSVAFRRIMDEFGADSFYSVGRRMLPEPPFRKART